MRHPLLGVFVIVCVTAAGCSDSAGPPTALVTSVERASLDSMGGLSVSFNIRNVGSQPEDVPACDGKPGADLQRQSGGRWESFAGAICLAIYSSAPISLQPGKSISGTTGAFRGGPGVYRLVISYQEDGSPRVVSQPFIDK